jgi:uncharacterized protein (TIGR02996 family)
MTHADVFLEEILAQPDDDTPRLIFADWLEDQNDPTSAARAEFIRVQVQLARMNDMDRRRPTLAARQWELLEHYGRVWSQPVQGLVSDWTFHRGFIDEVRVEAQTFIQRSGELFRLTPIQHVNLYWRLVTPMNRTFFLVTVIACPELNRLRSLDLSHGYLGSAGAQALSVCQHLTELTALNLTANHIGNAGARALASSPLLTRLTHLNLSHNDLGPAGVRSLAAGLEQFAAAEEGLPLRTLVLTGNKLGAAGMRAIAASPVLQRIARM